VPSAVFRLRLADGTERLAGGDVVGGPDRLLPAGITIDALLRGDGLSLSDAAASDGEPLPSGSTLQAPVEGQEIWAAGVTYFRSRQARAEEAIEATPYDRVYGAERPELFCKCAGWRVRGAGESVAVRADSTWDVPEPELTLVLDASVHIVGYTIGNDVSSRSIEGENTLYLPQAKTYDGSCAIGPAIVPAGAVRPPFAIRMSIERDGAVIYDGETSTAEMKRELEDIASYLGRAITFPVGVFLMTGTGIVPDPPFTLTDGDVVKISIEGLGMLENRVERLAPRP
jgi:2-dehydro-3-deoxy-D-arabinonate dehydratase